jgi:cytochrome c oxidase subunit 3
MNSEGRDASPRKGVARPRGKVGEEVPGASLLGMSFFLASLTVLFVASIVAYVVVRNRAHVWPPSNSPGLPLGFALSTVALIGGSIAMQSALRAIRNGQVSQLGRHLARAFVLSLMFMASQSANWLWYGARDSRFGDHLYSFTFYMFTGLHAAHVLGGCIAIVVVYVRTRMGYYSAAYHPGVRNAAIYWHYLGAVWFVLLALMLLDR